METDIITETIDSAMMRTLHPTICNSENMVFICEIPFKSSTQFQSLIQTFISVYLVLRKVHWHRKSPYLLDSYSWPSLSTTFSNIVLYDVIVKSQLLSRFHMWPLTAGNRISNINRSLLVLAYPSKLCRRLWNNDIHSLLSPPTSMSSWLLQGLHHYWIALCTTKKGRI